MYGSRLLVENQTQPESKSIYLGYEKFRKVCWTDKNTVVTNGANSCLQATHERRSLVSLYCEEINVVLDSQSY